MHGVLHEAIIVHCLRRYSPSQQCQLNYLPSIDLVKPFLAHGASPLAKHYGLRHVTHMIAFDVYFVLERCRGCLARIDGTNFSVEKSCYQLAKGLSLVVQRLTCYLLPWLYSVSGPQSNVSNQSSQSCPSTSPACRESESYSMKFKDRRRQIIYSLKASCFSSTR